jgi:hypothetical protein
MIIKQQMKFKKKENRAYPQNQRRRARQEWES